MLSWKRAYYPTAAAAMVSSPRSHKRYKASVTRVFSSGATTWSGCSNPTSGEEDSHANANRFSCDPQVNASGGYLSMDNEISSNQRHGSSDHVDEDDTSSSTAGEPPQPCGVTLTDDGRVVFAEDEVKIETPQQSRKDKIARSRRSKLPRLRVVRRGGVLSFDNETQRWVPDGLPRAATVRCASSTVDSSRCVSAELSVEEIDDRILMLIRRIEQDKPWQFAYRCLRVPFALDRKNDRMDFLFEHWDAFWRQHGHAIWERNYWAPLQVGSTEYNQRVWRQKAAKRAFYDLSAYLNAKLGLRFWNQLRREIYEGWWYRSRPFSLRRLFQHDHRGFDEYMSRARHRRRWPRGKKIAKGIDPTWCLGWLEGDETTDYEHINSESRRGSSDTVSSSDSEEDQSESSDDSSESDESLLVNESLENETDEESPDTRELFQEGNKEEHDIDSSGDGELGDDEFSDDDSEMDSSSSSSSDSEGARYDQVRQRSVMMVF